MGLTMPLIQLDDYSVLALVLVDLWKNGQPYESLKEKLIEHYRGMAAGENENFVKRMASFTTFTNRSIVEQLNSQWFGPEDPLILGESWGYKFINKIITTDPSTWKVKPLLSAQKIQMDFKLFLGDSRPEDEESAISPTETDYTVFFHQPNLGNHREWIASGWNRVTSQNWTSVMTAWMTGLAATIESRRLDWNAAVVSSRTIDNQTKLLMFSHHFDYFLPNMSKMMEIVTMVCEQLCMWPPNKSEKENTLLPATLLHWLDWITAQIVDCIKHYLSDIINWKPLNIRAGSRPSPIDISFSVFHSMIQGLVVASLEEFKVTINALFTNAYKWSMDIDVVSESIMYNNLATGANIRRLLDSAIMVGTVMDKLSQIKMRWDRAIHQDKENQGQLFVASELDSHHQSYGGSTSSSSHFYYGLSPARSLSDVCVWTPNGWVCPDVNHPALMPPTPKKGKSFYLSSTEISRKTKYKSLLKNWFSSRESLPPTSEPNCHYWNEMCQAARWLMMNSQELKSTIVYPRPVSLDPTIKFQESLKLCGLRTYSSLFVFMGNHEDTIERYWKQSILNTETTTTDEFIDCLNWVAELLRKVGSALNESLGRQPPNADALLSMMMQNYDLHNSEERIQDGPRLYHTKEILLELSYFDFSVCKPASPPRRTKRSLGSVTEDGLSRNLVLCWVEWVAPLWLNSVYGGPDSIRYTGGFTSSQSKSQLVRQHNRVMGGCRGGTRRRVVRSRM